MLGSLILYLKGMRITMFQLSGFYCRCFKFLLMVSSDSVGFEMFEKGLI